MNQFGKIANQLVKDARMSEQQKQYVSGTAKLESAFELRYTPGGKSIITAKAQFNDIEGSRFGDLAIWEPETWYDDTWWTGMTAGVQVGFRGTARDRSWTGKDGSQKSRREITCYAIGTLVERPRRGNEAYRG